MPFTSETARIAARNSHKPTSARYVHPVEVDSEAQAADLFRRTRLSRVRAQLNQLDEMLANETDPSKLDRLASAQARLSEQERQLSNRSMPPVLRAVVPKAKRPLEPSSEPVAAPVVVSVQSPVPPETPQST